MLQQRKSEKILYNSEQKKNRQRNSRNTIHILISLSLSSGHLLAITNSVENLDILIC